MRVSDVEANPAPSLRAVGKRLTRESAQAFASNTALKLVTIVASILLARMLGPDALGLWALVTSTSGWIWTLGELGLGAATVVVVGESRPDDRRCAEGAALQLGLLSATLTALGYMVLAPFFASNVYGVPESSILFVLSAATFIPLGLANIQVAILQARRQIGVLAVTGLTIGTVSALALVTGAALGGLRGVFVASLSANVIGAVVLVGLLRLRFREYPRLLGVFSSRLARRLASVGLPTMASAFFSLIGTWIALTVLAQSAPVEDVGFYNVAWRVSAFVVFPATAIFAAFFPFASEAYTANPPLFGRTHRETMRYSLIVTFPLAVVLIVLAPEVITTLYGATFAPAGSILALLAAAGFLQAFSGWGSAVFFVSRSMLRWVALVAVAVGLEIATATIVIPRWGVGGLVLSMLVLTSVTVGLSPVFLEGKAPGSHLRRYSAVAILLAAGLVGLGWVVRDLDFAVRAGILAAVLVAFAIALHRVVLTPPDRRFIGDLGRAVLRRL